MKLLVLILIIDTEFRTVFILAVNHVKKSLKFVLKLSDRAFKVIYVLV